MLQYFRWSTTVRLYWQKHFCTFLFEECVKHSHYSLNYRWDVSSSNRKITEIYEIKYTSPWLCLTRAAGSVRNHVTRRAIRMLDYCNLHTLQFPPFSFVPYFTLLLHRTVSSVSFIRLKPFHLFNKQHFRKVIP